VSLYRGYEESDEVETREEKSGRKTESWDVRQRVGMQDGESRQEGRR